MAVADLVLEGGGAKLPGLIGAISALTDGTRHYAFPRVAGTSAGAIVGALTAAGASAEFMKRTMLGQDFTEFEDVDPFFRALPALGRVEGLLLRRGMYRGEALRAFLTELLADLGVRTWADLRQQDPGSALPPKDRYKLVVMVSDVSRGRILRLPWDYRQRLGVDPDGQSVADAVYASAAIPFFFRPRRLPAEPRVVGHPWVLGADGGLLSRFPVGIFDRTDGAPARWPTIGVKLSAQETASSGWRSGRTTFGYAVAVLKTLVNARDSIHINDPDVVARTVFVDTTGYRSTDLDLSPEQKLDLFDRGVRAGERFLDERHGPHRGPSGPGAPAGPR